MEKMGIFKRSDGIWRVFMKKSGRKKGKKKSL